MINYALKCGQSHSFDSWFQSATAFDTLKAAGHVTCPICGNGQVEKAIMAPRITTGRKAARPVDDQTPPMPVQLGPNPDAETALAKLKAEIQANSDYVGMNFAAEARAIHEGDAPKRAIYGEAKLDEARALIEDGVPVAPLPFIPNRKVN